MQFFNIMIHFAQINRRYYPSIISIEGRGSKQISGTQVCSATDQLISPGKKGITTNVWLMPPH